MRLIESICFEFFHDTLWTLGEVFRGSKGKALLFALALAALSVGMTSRASAAVVSIFDSRTSILEGRRNFVALFLSLDDPEGFLDATFAGGSVTFFSGYETSKTFNMSSNAIGRRTADVRTFFDYPDAGTYTTSFSGVINFGIPLVISLFCGGPVIIECGSEITFPLGIDSQSISGSATLTVTATPLPAALPLFGAGLGLWASSAGGVRGAGKRSPNGRAAPCLNARWLAPQYQGIPRFRDRARQHLGESSRQVREGYFLGLRRSRLGLSLANLFQE